MSSAQSAIKLDSSMPLGYLKKLLADQGITDVKQVAEQMQALKRMHEEKGFYSHDGYTEEGSGAHARILDGRSARDCIVWSINHYLGLNRNERVIRSAQEAAARFGTGCGTSAMSGGRCSLHREIEDRLAADLEKEKVLLYPTGFTANIGTISGLLSKRDLILSDGENHASIIDGCRASRAEVLPFVHNDTADLEKKLKRYTGDYENVLVIVESAYSMSGDLAPLEEIAALRERYGFLLYVDEAHTFGFYGEGGRGYCHELGVSDQVDFLMSTLSKATASIGGFVAMEEKFATMLTWSSRPYLFQACFPPADAAAILAALDEIKGNPGLAKQLHENNDYFRGRLRDAGFNLGQSQSPVVPVFIEDIDALLAITTELFERGIYTVSINYPVVGFDEGRLRFICNAAHTREEIDKTVDVLTDLCRRHGVI